MYDQTEKAYDPMAMQAGAKQVSKDGPITEQVHRINKSLEGMGSALAELESRLSPILMGRTNEKTTGPVVGTAANCQLHGMLLELAMKAAIQRESLQELIGRIQL